MEDVEAVSEDSENSEVLPLNLLGHAHGPSLARGIAKIAFTILVGFPLAIFLFDGAKTTYESTSMTWQNKGNIDSINTNDGGTINSGDNATFNMQKSEAESEKDILGKQNKKLGPCLAYKSKYESLQEAVAWLHQHGYQDEVQHWLFNGGHPVYEAWYNHNWAGCDLLCEADMVSDNDKDMCDKCKEELKKAQDDPQDADAWFHLGVKTPTGTVNVAGRAYSRNACYLMALKENESYAPAWYNLGIDGGGEFQGQKYSRKECYGRALKLDGTNADAWNSLGLAGGGKVGVQYFNRKQCFIKALESDPTNVYAWGHLSDEGGGEVHNKYFSKVDCLVKARAIHLYDCDLGFSNWYFGWSDVKKGWCCEHKHMGCPGTWHGSWHHTAATTLSPLGCNAQCVIDGESRTCKERMDWAQEHIFGSHSNSCELAYSKVQVECDVCRACAIQAAGCGEQGPEKAAFE